MAQTNAKGKYLAPDEIAMFCEQVALILKSGIPLYDGIEALCETYRDTQYAQTFDNLNKVVKESGTLFSAVEQAGIFPPYMVEMIHIGETAGKLDDVMDGLAEHYQREDKVRASIKNAVLYPVVMVMMMAVVIAVLVSKVMPIFNQVFRSLGSEMDTTMTTIMNFGVTVGYAVLVLVAVLLVVLLIGFILYKTGHGRGVTRLINRLFPPIRRVMEKTSSGRFASVLSMMMTAGFPIGEALDLTPKVLTDERTLEKVNQCARAINENGVELPKAIAQAELFEPIYNKMIQVGFYAGQMDRVMKKIADIYDDEIDDGIRHLVGLIEPSLVAVLAIVIGGILLAVMLPLASIMSSIL